MDEHAPGESGEWEEDEEWEEGSSRRLNDAEEDEGEDNYMGEGMGGGEGVEAAGGGEPAAAPPPSVMANAWSCGEGRVIYTGFQGELVLLLGGFECAYVSGNAKVMPLVGKVRVFGTTLMAGEDAPGGGSWTQIAAIAPCGPFGIEGAGAEGTGGLNRVVSAEDLARAEVCQGGAEDADEKLIKLLEDALDAWPCALLIRGSALSRTRQDPALLSMEEGLVLLESLVGCSIIQGSSSSLLQPMVIAPEWRRIADRILGGGAARGPQRVAAVGVKGSGKSCLVRYLCNVLVGRYGQVALLDTDVGQTEATPPGLLSLVVVRAPLLGPPDSHVQQPHCSIFYGEMSPEEDPGLFLHGCKRLMLAYRELATKASDTGGIPLVVNTCGWVKGLGLELLEGVLAQCEVTHVCLCTVGNPKKDLAPPDMGPGYEAALQFDASGSKRAVKRRKKAYEAAYGKPLADGGDAGEGGRGGGRGRESAGGDEGDEHVEEKPVGSSWVPKGAEVAVVAPLKLEGTRCSLPPPELRNRAMIAYFGGRGLTPQQCSSLLAKTPPYAVPISALRVHFMRAAVPPRQMLSAILGTVVGLCRGAGDVSTCVGLGIVRAVDPAEGTLFLVTPVAPDVLEGVDTLVRGRHELCIAMLDWHCGGVGIAPYLAAGSLGAGSGSGPMRSRSGIMRKGHAAA